jgi:glutamine amidotransferase PdxT
VAAELVAVMVAAVQVAQELTLPVLEAAVQFESYGVQAGRFQQQIQVIYKNKNNRSNYVRSRKKRKRKKE